MWPPFGSFRRNHYGACMNVREAPRARVSLNPTGPSLSPAALPLELDWVGNNTVPMYLRRDVRWRANAKRPPRYEHVEHSMRGVETFSSQGLPSVCATIVHVGLREGEVKQGFVDLQTHMDA